MSINTTPKEMPTGDGNPTAGSAINTLDCSSSERNEKAFFSLRAAYAMKGCALYRTDPADGPVNYWADCGGSARILPNIDAAQLSLVQIGGLL